MRVAKPRQILEYGTLVSSADDPLICKCVETGRQCGFVATEEDGLCNACRSPHTHADWERTVLIEDAT